MVSSESDGGKRKQEEDYEGADFSDDGTHQNKIADIKKRKEAQNKIRCQRYRDKKKKERNKIVSSQIKKEPRSIVEEKEIIGRRKEYDRQKSQRYRDKKRASHLIKLHTDQSSKAVVRHVSKRENFHNKQVADAGPSTRNLPNVPPIYTADLSTQNEPYIPESYANNDNNIHIDPHSQVNYVPQLHEPIKTNYMFCIQEKETDPFANTDQDPLSGGTQSDSSDDEPAAKRLKPTSYTNSALNLQVYKIPAFNTPKSLSIFPSIPTPSQIRDLPQFVNNPLNLANPLAFAANNLSNLHNANSIVKSLQNRYSLPAKLTITPVQSPKPPVLTNSGEVIRYKKNGEIAKKRGPPKGYKRKPKIDYTSLTTGVALLQAQNTILTKLLETAGSTISSGCSSAPSTPVTIPHIPQQLVVVPQIRVPEGVELVELLLDPEDWFPDEPYKMTFSRKKNPKWKSFPYRCEHCFKGYRIISTLIQHAAERHGCVPKETAIPCPCCPHVSTRRKQHKKHLEGHESRKHRIFCLYCLPPPDYSEPFVKESEKYPYDKFPQYWYASEESLRLHKKRKHPYAAMFNYNWYCTWGDLPPNS